MNDLTQVLEGCSTGDPQASELLLPLVYNELRRLAAARLASLPAGQSIQATALVHEAYLRLVRSPSQKWSGRAHFFGAAAEAMRRILIERARQYASQKRGGGLQRVDLDSVELAVDSPSEVILALDEVLTRFAAKEPKSAELVKLRFFAGLSHEEAAATLNLADRTAKRMWAFARAWLLNEIEKSLGDPGSGQPPASRR